MSVSQSTSHSRPWDTAAVAAEEAYHFAGMALCAYDLVLDTYYGVKPKSHIGGVVVSMAIFVFHTLFLDLLVCFWLSDITAAIGFDASSVRRYEQRRRPSSVMPSKLVYLLDMLLHVGAFATDAALVVSLLQYPPEDIGIETRRVRWRVVGYSTSIPVLLIRIVYHIGILATYYHWVQVKPPPTTASCSASNCVSWLRETVRNSLHRRPVIPLVPPPLLGEALERDRQTDAQQPPQPGFNPVTCRSAAEYLSQQTTVAALDCK
ncbi:hypothetical protein HPB51_019621 [Rhipicephalus microplus]|uniref:Uncharacterized protein n=1 Tax=Rhipicephalus microplus TaxID=6941 RepID=A0A9J6F5P6_RHIMP|nr:hypothetical protein HPB51_019621 [Rhipicephalus microplus]